jgi:hypothetical protein
MRCCRSGISLWRREEEEEEEEEEAAIARDLELDFASLSSTTKNFERERFANNRKTSD